MSSEKNIIKVYFKGTHLTHSKTQYQYNHGMILHFADLNLPQAFETHFANKQHGNSKTVIGSENKVEIPDEYFWTGANEIFAWVYLHSDVDDGETVFEVRIPLTKRAKPSDEEPLPDQQSAIDRAIAELNHAVEQTGADVEQTNSDREAVSEMRDEVSDLKDSAEESANIATQKAQEASTSASNAEDSEQEAKGYADDAKRYAENAFSSKEIAVAKASEAEGYASDAEQAKTDAEDARSDTVQLKQDVVALKEQTDTNVTHYPKIVDGYWYVWNARQNDFVDTGVEATGEKGDQGDKGDKGDKGESGVYVGDDEPLDEDYNVWVDTDDGDVVESVVQDVQINGVSIVDNNEVANIPVASNSTLGLVRGIDTTTNCARITSGFIGVYSATSQQVKEGTVKIQPIVPSNQHESTFYGLAKASGDTTQSQSNNPVGTYTDEAKTAIQNMLGVPSVDDISSGLENIKDDMNNGVIEGLVTGDLVNIARGSYSHSEGYNTTSYGFASHAEGEGTFVRGYYSHVEGMATKSERAFQHVQGKYNVVDTAGAGQSERGAYVNIVGNGADENHRSNAYALDWDGNGHYKGDVYVGANADSTGGTKVATLSDIPTIPVTDVQINGNSILSDGVANVPVASTNGLGVVKVNTNYGTTILNNAICISRADDARIKDGLDQTKPITPIGQHRAVFYGLAKAAGDTTQKQSSNSVGTYTEDAKSAISDMLNGSVTVSGTTPTIVAKSGIRYVCGEVASLDFTPCASGICDVVFTSGSTPTVLVVPSTVKWANGFDPTSLDANTTYELNIMDGLGVCGTWT